MTTSVASEPFLFTPVSSPAATGSDRTASRQSTSSTASVDQARQEISQIVREVAAAARSDETRENYLRFLSDRILRAMAAHGVVIWHADDAAEGLYRYQAAHCLGTVTHRGFDETTSAVHDRLLLEVAGQNAPVVVPPTPRASDVDVPANPTEHPAAIVPILVDPSVALPTWLLEVFLEPGGSPTSQRGALRFLAQMGDLAAEFLRADQLRELTRRVALMHQCALATEQIGKLNSTRKIEAALVDTVARLLNCPRVALCRVDRGHPQIVAVSHVDRIDQHSDAASEIRTAAASSLLSGSSLCFAALQMDRRSGADRRAEQPNSASTNPPPVLPRWVIATSHESPWRLVLLEPCEAKRALDVPPPDMQMALPRLLIGSQLAWSAAQRVEAIPGGRWWSQWTVANDEHSGTEQREHAGFLLDTHLVSSIRRRVGLISAVAITTVLLMCMPIPAIIPATGLIRPLEIDIFHAISDATVQTLQVHHGQSVRRGDVLATLVSRDLSERKTTLLGRRAVLMQRRIQLNHALTASNQTSGGMVDLQSDQEIDEEIDAIDRQLEIIADSEADLVLRAHRDGRVDAWRLQERLAGRPLRRGDAVLSVIADDTTWVVDATIPQRRVSRVDRAIRSQQLTAEVTTRWNPGQSHSAMAHRFGPVVADPVDGTPSVILRLTLSDAPRLGDQPLSETPARVSVHCGRISIGWFLLEDVAGWLQTRIGAYL